MARETHDWLLEHMPPSLREIGPQHLEWWQWLGLPLLALVALGLAVPLSRISRALIERLLRRDTQSGEPARLHRVSGPLLLGWATLLYGLGLPWLRLHDAAGAAVHVGLRAVGLLAFYWALSRGIDVLEQILAGSGWGQTHSSTRSVLPLGAKVAKVFVVVLAVVAFLSELGYPVASLVAGLGIGGVAVALGAQKTLENLFGAFSMGADQPFLQGDLVRVGDLVGNVEVVGLRSTRIRTQARTLVTIPNGKLAEQQIESFAERDRLLFSTTLRLVYGTRASQLRAILGGLEAVLRDQPKLWPQGVVVRLVGLSESSLDVDVAAWFATTDWSEFLAIREQTLLRFMEVVEREGSAFAFPTRTLHLVGGHLAGGHLAGGHLVPSASAPGNPQPAGDT